MACSLRRVARAAAAAACAALAFAPPTSLAAAVPPPAGRCQPRLDAFCNSEAMSVCLGSMRTEGFKLPLVARFDRGQTGDDKEWRCYSPSSLSPDLSHYTGGRAYCTSSELEALLGECETNTTAVLVFGKGTDTPGGPLIRATEPSLLLIPPDASNPNGTLLAVAGGETAAAPGDGRALVLRRSADGGVTWSATTFPMGPPADIRTVGSFFQNQLLWDAATGTAIINVGNITTHANSCGNGGSMEDLDGMLQLTSTDRGVTWSQAAKVSPLGAPTTCLAPTTGHGVAMTNPNTPAEHKGRLLFAAVHNAYHGDVVIYSDDNAHTWSSSGASLHLAGLDEISIAQLPNGSLAGIIRNCMPGTSGCQMLDGQHGGVSGDDDARAGSGGGGGKRFLWTTSDDGGATWAHPRPHPDLVTPVCQGSITGYNGALYFVGPYSPTARHNLTVLASDNNGETFGRSLLLWAGNGGYTGLQCGLPGRVDCGVLFDGAGGPCDGICFLPFASDSVK